MNRVCLIILVIVVFSSCKSQKKESCNPVENGFVEKVGEYKDDRINSIVIHSNDGLAEVQNLFDGKIVALDDKHGDFVTIKSTSGLATQYALFELNENLKMNTFVAKGELLGHFYGNIKGSGFMRLSFNINADESFYKELTNCLTKTSSKAELKKYLKLQKKYQSYEYGDEFDN